MMMIWRTQKICSRNKNYEQTQKRKEIINNKTENKKSQKYTKIEKLENQRQNKKIEH